MVTIQELQIQYDTQVQEWIPDNNAVTEEIENTIEKLKEHHRNVKIARAAGVGATVTGVGTAILGIALAPVTVGASVGLIVGGVALAVAGGSTAAGASIAEAFIQKNNIKRVQEKLDHADQLFDAISRTAKAIEEKIGGARQRCPDISAREFAAVFEEVVIVGVVRSSNVAVRLAELGAYGTLEKGVVASQVGIAAANGIVAAGTVLNATLLPINLVEIIVSSFSLARGSQTKAIKKLTDTLQQLKEQRAAIEDLQV
jgi:hypothetical protein